MLVLDLPNLEKPIPALWALCLRLTSSNPLTFMQNLSLNIHLFCMFNHNCAMGLPVASDRITCCFWNQSRTCCLRNWHRGNKVNPPIPRVKRPRVKVQLHSLMSWPSSWRPCKIWSPANGDILVSLIQMICWFILKIPNCIIAFILFWMLSAVATSSDNLSTVLAVTTDWEKASQKQLQKSQRGQWQQQQLQWCQSLFCAVQEPSSAAPRVLLA